MENSTLHPAVQEFLREFRSKGGHARSQALTPEQRSRIARKAGLARAKKAKLAKQAGIANADSEACNLHPQKNQS